MYSLWRRTQNIMGNNIQQNNQYINQYNIHKYFKHKITYPIIHDPEKIDDKDYYGNKRLELAGQLLSLLFEDLLKKFNSDLKAEADRSFSRASGRPDHFDITSCIRKDTVTYGLERAISSGNWSLKRFKMERAGVTQVLSRMSYLYSIGMMCRINSQFEKTRKISGPRALQPSQWGMVCPSDTPEGESCGLVKTLAMTSHVTTDQPELPLINLAINLGMEDADLLNAEDFHSKAAYTVFLNGRPLGVHKNPIQFVNDFRMLRRKGLINECISIYQYEGQTFVQAETIYINSIERIENNIFTQQYEGQNAIYISSDGGRLIRPLIVVKDGQPQVGTREISMLLSGLINFADLVKTAKVEYLDVNEENEALIALTEKYIKPDQTTHLEIAPFTILSCVAGVIPYPHHNQSPRNTYQCAMGKQAIGTTGYNQLKRVDNVLYMLLYPQKPLVCTKQIYLIHYDELPAGMNASVAIMSYSGYDIEDAIIMNKASLDRGFARVVINRRVDVPLKSYLNGTRDVIAQPPQVESYKGLPPSQKKYRWLEADGLTRVGAKVEAGDIYINKQSPVIQNNIREKIINPEYHPTPCSYKSVEPSYVDRVIITENPEDPCPKTTQKNKEE